MSVFKEKEVMANVYHVVDSNSTKKSLTNTNADFSIKIFPIRRSEEAVAVMGEEIGEWIANVNAEYTNAENIRRGDKIVWDSKTYLVTNKPRLNNLFNSYKLFLREIK